MDKRMVLSTPETIGIFGWLPDGEQPPPILDSPLGPINYVATKLRYHLYHLIHEPKMGYDFNPQQQ